VPNFRAAQSATAEIPEFKGTVAVVHTDRFWDQQLAELDQRNARIIRRMQEVKKEGKLSRAERNALQEKLIDEAFTEEELKVYRAGRSAQSFHYLGSAKIYGQIGKAFAEAMLEMSN
jgi:hypothetical protein